MTVHIEKGEHVWTVIIDRPASKNAIDHATAALLAEAFRAFDADANARVAVLASEGDTFCAGADLKAIARGEPNEVTLDGDAPLGPTRLVLDKPVIAAIQGHAVAGGLELALWCDLRVIEEDGILGVFCRRFGVPLIDGGTIRLPRLIGMSRALDLILTGRAVPAREAEQMGLVNRVVPKGEARKAAQTLAEEIAAFPQAAMRADRRSAQAQWASTLERALRAEFEGGIAALAAEGLDGATRFSQGVGRHGRFDAAAKADPDERG